MDNQNGDDNQVTYKIDTKMLEKVYWKSKGFNSEKSILERYENGEKGLEDNLNQEILYSGHKHGFCYKFNSIWANLRDVDCK